MKRRTEIVERVRGSGHVSRSNERVANVRYSLEVLQEMLITEAFGGQREELPGMKRVRGSIEILGGESDLWLISDGLVLHLEDGRQLPFTPGNTMVGTGRYRIEGSGALE